MLLASVFSRIPSTVSAIDTSLAKSEPLNSTFPNLSTPFSIRITDSTGKTSLSSSTTTTLTFPRNKLSKRATYSIVNVCPSGYSFDTSYCLVDRPLQWLIRCILTDLSTESEDRPIWIGKSGSCYEGELCVQVPSLVEENHVFREGITTSAFCINLEQDYSRYPIDTTEGSGQTSDAEVSAGASQVGLPSSSLDSSRYALEAILTDTHTEHLLNASSLRVSAQKAINVHGHILWQTLPGGLSSCTDCANLSVDPVPDGTQAVAVELMLQPGVTAGNLFLGSFEL